MSSSFKNVKIISDGTPRNTHLVDAETGEQVPGIITKITWTAEAGYVTRAVVEYAKVPVEITGEGKSKLDMHEMYRIVDAIRGADGSSNDDPLSDAAYMELERTLEGLESKALKRLWQDDESLPVDVPLMEQIAHEQRDGLDKLAKTDGPASVGDDRVDAW